jgi:hypothetical protein
MEYPLDMTKAPKGNVPAGFAVANTKEEHQALTAQGFEPAYVAAPAKPAKDAPKN